VKKRDTNFVTDSNISAETHEEIGVIKQFYWAKEAAN